MQNERITLKTVPQSDRSFEEYQNKEAIVSSSDATSAAFDLAWRDTAVGLWARSDAIDELESGGAPKITADEANKLYPYLDEPFSEDVNPYVARLKADQQLEKQELQRKMSLGPEDNWTKSKMFGAGLVAHLLDPVEFGAGSIVGWSIGGAASAGMLGQGAKTIATTAAAPGAKLGSRLAFDAIEGAGGALIENVVQEGAQKAVEFKEGVVDERSNAEIATDILYGSIAAFGLQAVPKSIARGVDLGFEGTKRMLRNTSPEADLAIARHTMAAAETGNLPDITPLQHTLAKETDVNPGNFGRETYVHTPTQILPDGTANLEGKKFYIAKEAPAPNAASKALGEDFGIGGTHITDNPGVANAASARSMSDSVGEIQEVSVQALRPLDVDKPFPPGLFEKFDKIFQDAEIGVMDYNVPARIVLGDIRNSVDAGVLPESVLDDVNRLLRESGHDSLISNGKSNMGVEHSPHNHITLLDDGKVTPIRSLDPDPAVVRAPTPEEVRSIQERQPKEFLGAEDTYAKEIQAIRSSALEELNTDTQKLVNEAIEEFDYLSKQELLDEDALKVLVEIKENVKNTEDGFTMLKAFKACSMKD